MNKKTVEQIFKNLSLAILQPTTELIYHSNFELLIAVILSARTTDKTVNKATSVLFQIADTPEKILKLGVAKLKKYIKCIGLYNTKAQNIIKTCKILVDKYGSEIPNNRQELEQLPGVGRKTANVILNIAFNQPTIAVDTHVFRVCKRLGLSAGKTPQEVETELLKIVPKKYAKTAGNLLLLYGRYFCTARKPKCDICLLKPACKYQKSLPK